MVERVRRLLAVVAMVAVVVVTTGPAAQAVGTHRAAPKTPPPGWTSPASG